MWVVDRADARALAELGDVLLEFHGDGRLTYTIRCDNKNQIILMRYKVEGDTVVTDQPSAPREERTAYSLSPDGILTLEFGGTPYRFRRPENPSPSASPSSGINGTGLMKVGAIIVGLFANIALCMWLLGVGLVGSSGDQLIVAAIAVACGAIFGMVNVPIVLWTVSLLPYLLLAVFTASGTGGTGVWFVLGIGSMQMLVVWLFRLIGGKHRINVKRD
jgi:hypothetical protein